jgi:hypothetical protein
MARKKAAQRAAPQVAESIFDHFEQHGRSLGGEPNPQPQDAAQGPDTAELLRRLDALEQQNTELRRTALLSAEPPLREAAIVDPAKAVLDLKGLPDPVDKPTEYNTELATRINAVVDQRVHAVQQGQQSAVEQAAAADRLWQGFVTKHPEWADYPDLVGTVAKNVVDDATKRGIDPQKYLFVTSDLYFDDVAKVLDEKYGALVEDADEPAGQEPAQRAQTTGQEPGPDRTAGIWGGPESGNRPSSGAAPQAGPGDMFKDLTDVQKRMGLL